MLDLLLTPAQFGRDITPEYLVSALVVIFLAIGIHEYCHAKFADMAGDPTARIHGRVTLNLFNHFDPIGTMMIIFTVLAGFGIGWGRPVPMNPAKMRNPRWDHFAAVAAGPLSNLAQAVVYAFILRGMVVAGIDAPALVLFAFIGVTINLALFFFNLIPLGPLDGMWILGTFLPSRTADRWTYWNMKYGMYAFLGILMLGWFTPFNPISLVLGPPVMALRSLLTGL